MQAIDQVRQKGYGVVTPERSEIELEAPEVIRHGSKYGVKIKAKSPSIHMIRANIETEIAPIVGTKEQAEDLIGYIGRYLGYEYFWQNSGTDGTGRYYNQNCNDRRRKPVEITGQHAEDRQ